jgi:predicted NBD/HSP70 family sugar kinase
MVYIGVDLHRKRSQLAAMDDAGELLFNRSIPSESDAFLRVFGELAPEPIAVAFEATIGWGPRGRGQARRGAPEGLARNRRRSAPHGRAAAGALAGRSGRGQAPATQS